MRERVARKLIVFFQTYFITSSFFFLLSHIHTYIFFFGARWVNDNKLTFPHIHSAVHNFKNWWNITGKCCLISDGIFNLCLYIIKIWVKSLKSAHTYSSVLWNFCLATFSLLFLAFQTNLNWHLLKSNEDFL